MEELSLLAGEESPVALTPISASIRATLNRFRQMGLFGHLDEETITGSLLGAISATLPFCVALYGENVPPEKLCWGHFPKSGAFTKPPSEAETGADFALVVYATKDVARLALFQAKRVPLEDVPGSLVRQSNTDKRLAKKTPFDAAAPALFAHLKPIVDVPSGRWLMDVHRRPRKKPPAPWREAQLQVLADFASKVAQCVDQRVDKILADLGSLSSDRLHRRQPERLVQGREAIMAAVESWRPGLRFADAHWVHYLGYATGVVAALDTKRQTATTEIEEVISVPLCDLAEAHWRELTRTNVVFSHNWVDLSTVRCFRFSELMLQALSPLNLSPPPDGWITVDNAVLAEVLPGLMELTTVYVGDDKGGVAGLPLALRNAIARLSVDASSNLGAAATAAARPVVRKYRSPGTK